MDSNLLIVTIEPRSALCYMLFRMFFHLLFPVTSYSPFLSSCRQRGHSSKGVCDLLTIAQLISSSISKTKELALFCVVSAVPPAVCGGCLTFHAALSQFGISLYLSSPRPHEWLAWCAPRPMPRNSTESVSTCKLQVSATRPGIPPGPAETSR